MFEQFRGHLRIIFPLQVNTYLHMYIKLCKRVSKRLHNFPCFNIPFPLCNSSINFLLSTPFLRSSSFLCRLSSLDYRTSTKNIALNLSDGHRLSDPPASLDVFPERGKLVCSRHGDTNAGQTHPRPRYLGKRFFTFLHIHEHPGSRAAS